MARPLLSLCLAALACERGERLQPFKVGPDYLDPQLLSELAGSSCRNLDTLLCGPEWVQRCFHWHGSRADRVLVEGVMGLFDGRGPSSEGSSAEVAALLDLPVVLVVEASRQAGSLAALVRGFRDHGPPQVQIAGVVLNRVSSERHRALLAEALAAIDMPLLGVLPQDPSLVLPSRHLGLLPPGELGDLGQRRRRWARIAEHQLDLERLWPLLAPAPQVPAGTPDPILWTLDRAEPPYGGGELDSGNEAAESVQPAGPTRAIASGGDRDPRPATPLPVAIASDQAFHFRYPEVSELLRALGLDPRPWSPLADAPLPAGCRAVLLPGGYPELHAAQLADARRSLSELARAAAAGLPIVAECGGLLLLGQCLHDAEDRPHAMAGVLPFSARRGPLTLGYREARAHGDGLLMRHGERVIGHEFHRWQLQREPVVTDGRDGDAAVMAAVAGTAPMAPSPGLWQLEGWGWPRRSEGWTNATLHASWLHLHWAGCPVIPRRLAAAAASAVPLPMNAASCNPGKPGSPPAVNAGV